MENTPRFFFFKPNLTKSRRIKRNH